MTLYLLQYNNYFNRQVKGFDNIEDYPEEIYAAANITNWNPNDGVQTEVVLNTERSDGDYLIVVDPDGKINSRWFVMEATRTRVGQYRFSLLRDVMYDFKQQIITSPCYIERAMVDLNNPFIYHNEGVGYNEIKTKEILLKDSFQIPWIVGYIKKDIATEPTITITPDVDGTYDAVVPTLSDYRLYQYLEKKLATNTHDIKFGLRTYNAAGISGAKPIIYGFDPDANLADPPIGTAEDNVFGSRIGSAGAWGFGRLGDDSAAIDKLYDEIPAAAKTQLGNLQGLIPTVQTYLLDGREELVYIDDIETITNDNNKLVYVEDESTTYRIKIVNTMSHNYVKENVNLVSRAGGILLKVGNACDSLKTAANSEFSESKSPYSMGATFDIYEVRMEAVASKNISIKLPVHDMRSCAKQPYNIFAIPCGNLSGSFGIHSDTQFVSSAEGAFQLAAAISEALGSNLIDLQLLPYCPIPQSKWRGSRGRPSDLTSYGIDFSVLTEKLDYTLVPVKMNDPALYTQALFYIDTPNFTVQQMVEPVRDEDGFIEGMSPSVYIECPKTATAMKVENETKKYRFVSPNYNGSFEMSAAKNKGLFNIKADCSYKPFSPYIRIYPQFDGLYGTNYQDSRGLVCGGDFGLPQTSDAWTEYQIQNKNYQVMFDRQIQNLDVNNNIAQNQAITGAVTGAIGAAGQGAAVGMAAGPWGAVAGAVIGGVASAAGGAQDIYYLKKTQEENRSYAIDQFGYELGNIKARPDNITKISAFDINNKLFPFLEIFSATEEERRDLLQKIKYNSMTIMAIGTIRQYLQPTPTFIQGKMIRLEGLNEDFHIATVIAEEINKGVYI